MGTLIHFGSPQGSQYTKEEEAENEDREVVRPSSV